MGGGSSGCTELPPESARTPAQRRSAGGRRQMRASCRSAESRVEGRRGTENNRPVSCPRHLKPLVRISRKRLSCRLPPPGYATYHAATAAGPRPAPPRPRDTAFTVGQSARRSVLQTTERHYQPLLPQLFLTTTCRQQGPFARRALPRVTTTTDPSATRSSHPPLPRSTGYKRGLLQRLSLWDETGFSSCLVCPVSPCCRCDPADVT